VTLTIDQSWPLLLTVVVLDGLGSIRGDGQFGVWWWHYYVCLTRWPVAQAYDGEGKINDILQLWRHVVIMTCDGKPLWRWPIVVTDGDVMLQRHMVMAAVGASSDILYSDQYWPSNIWRVLANVDQAPASDVTYSRPGGRKLIEQAKPDLISDNSTEKWATYFERRDSTGPDDGDTRAGQVATCGGASGDDWYATLVKYWRWRCHDGGGDGDGAKRPALDIPVTNYSTLPKNDDVRDDKRRQAVGVHYGVEHRRRRVSKNGQRGSIANWPSMVWREGLVGRYHAIFSCVNKAWWKWWRGWRPSRRWARVNDDINPGMA